MHEGRGYRYTFQRARVASSPEVPKVTWWKIVTFLGYHLHWLTSLETSRHFRKIALRLGIFLAMFWECLCVVARQLAPKCCDFSNVAKLARQCKWPLWNTLYLSWHLCMCMWGFFFSLAVLIVNSLFDNLHNAFLRPRLNCDFHPELDWAIHHFEQVQAWSAVAPISPLAFAPHLMYFIVF